MQDTTISNQETSLSGGDEVINVPEALQIPTRTVALSMQLLIGVANLVVHLSILPVSLLLLPTQVAAFDPVHKISNYGFVATLGAFAALLANLFAGALSDRTTSRLGRRRPWLIGGTLAGGIILAVLASAPNVLVLTLAWTLLQACLNLVLAALGAIVPDQIPVRQRATASAFVGLSAPVSILLGDILIAVLVTSTSLSYYTIMGLLLTVMLLFVLVMRDPVLPAEAAPPLHIRSFLTSFWINPMRYPDFGWTWLTRFLVYLSYNLTFSYLLYYVQDALHYEQLFPGQRASQGIAILQLITTGTSLLAAISSGVLSDRLQRRKVFVMCASIFIALSLLSLAFFRNWQEVEIVAVFLGIGLGSYFAVDNALVTQVITSTSVRGKDMSVLNIANALPAALAPTIGAIILTIVHSYTPFFVLAGILASLGAVLVLPIKSVR